MKPARVVISLFSRESVERPWINFEAGGAYFAEGKILIPICIGDIRPELLPKPYSNIQGGHLTDFGTPYYLVSRIWNFFDLPKAIPLPFRLDDGDVKRLLQSLADWEQLRKMADLNVRATKLLEELDRSKPGVT